MGAGLFDLKVQPNEVLGKTLFDYFQTRDASFPIIAAHERSLQGESVSLDVDWQGRIFHAHVEPLYQVYGHIIGAIGVALDMTERNRVEEEFRMARRIQQGLLPRTSPIFPPFEIAGISYPAEATGGDYFDFIPLPDGSLGVVIGDVSGHGFGPALLMATARAHLRALARVHTDVREILTLANRLLAQDIREDHFVTLLFARFDPRTHSLVYASAAGHQPGYVFKSSGAVKTHLPSTGSPLGLFADGEFPTSEVIPLEPGDIVLFLTDGVLEACSPEGICFGDDRVRDLVRINRRLGSSQIVENLYHAVRAFCRLLPQIDDIGARWPSG